MAKYVRKSNSQASSKKSNFLLKKKKKNVVNTSRLTVPGGDTTGAGLTSVGVKTSNGNIRTAVAATSFGGGTGSHGKNKASDCGAIGLDTNQSVQKKFGLIQINQLVMPYVTSTPYYILDNESLLSNLYIPSSFSHISGFDDQSKRNASKIQIDLINCVFKKMSTSSDLKKSIDQWNKEKTIINIHQAISMSKLVPFIKYVDLETRNVIQSYEPILNFEGGVLNYLDGYIPYVNIGNNIVVIETEFDKITVKKFGPNQYVVNDSKESIKDFLTFLGILLIGRLENKYQRTDKLIDITKLVKISKMFKTITIYDKTFPDNWKVVMCPHTTLEAPDSDNTSGSSNSSISIATTVGLANSSCKKSDSHGAGNASVAGTSSDDGSNNNNKQSDGSTNGAVDKILNDYVSTDVVGTSSGSGNKKASDGSTPVAGKTPGGDKKLNVNVGTQVAGTSSSGGHVSRFSKKASDGSTPVAGKTPGGDKKLNVNVGTQVAGTSSSGHVSRNTTKESEGSTLVAGSSTGSHVSNKASDGSALAPRRYKVLFQKDFKDKIEEYKKHYANLDQLAYVVVQSINRHKDDINYPISGIKGLKLVTKNKKKTLLVNVEFEGDWPQEEKQMWCTHSNVAASELIERYMVENDLEWEVDFRGYTKNKKKCYVDVESESEDEEYEDEAAELKKRIDKYKNILD